MPAAAFSYRSSAKQRATVREFVDLLERDLYRRDGGGDASARWVSPLGWIVEYGYNDDRETIWCAIVDPGGRAFARNDLATVYWLNDRLL